MEENIKPTSKRRARKIISLALFLIIFSAVIYFGYTQYQRWYQQRKIYIDAGLTEDHFPYRFLSERELVDKGLWDGESPALNAVPTRTTPEETYAKFRQALIDGDIDKAAECFVERKREEYKDLLQKAKAEGKIQEIIIKLTDIYPEGEKITKGSTGDSSTSYTFMYKEQENDLKFKDHVIVFYKNWDGDWLMDNL